MRKVFIASLAAVVLMAFVPTAPAQVPALPPEATGPLCENLPDVAALLGIACPGGKMSDSLADDGTLTDGWAFSGSAGQTLHYFVDNVDSGADLRARVCATASGTGCSLFGDDQTDCTVAPPGGYSCPEVTGALPADGDADGVYYLFVGAWSCCFFSSEFPHDYVISALDLDGSGITAVLEIDDDA